MANEFTLNAKYSRLPLSTIPRLQCALTGTELLNNAFFNKGSGFTHREREEFGLVGLLPVQVFTLEEQVARARQQYLNRKDPLAKNTFMTSLRIQNETLFYRLVQEHIKEMFSIIYTPTEGDAIQSFSRLFRKPEGIFLSVLDQDEIENSLARWGKSEEIDYIVVSDGEEILGIGDQGVGAILISVAKLVLCTLCAGVHPNRTLPVVLDCGTNNKDLLNDELYLGLRRPRVRGEAYLSFVDKFVAASRKLYPAAAIHFEDFGLENARRLLERYGDKIPCFNDDIQGTGCVTLAAIMSALHVCKLKLIEARIVIFGSGSAGMGIADQLRDAIAEESGESLEEAASKIWPIDKPGLLLASFGDKLTSAQKFYARKEDSWNDKKRDLLSVVKEVKPHVLIGTSTVPGAFTEEVCREMAKGVERPIIFPLSNPTRLHEAVPKDITEWTNGKALIATGSPFDPVEYDGETREIAECNNSVCFPGISLAVILSRAKLLTTPLLVAAVKALAAQGPAFKDPKKPLLPDVTSVRDVSIEIAAAVIQAAVKEGLAQAEGIPEDPKELRLWIKAQMWNPTYRELEKVNKDTASRSALGQVGISGTNDGGI